MKHCSYMHLKLVFQLKIKFFLFGLNSFLYYSANDLSQLDRELISKFAISISALLISMLSIENDAYSFKAPGIGCSPFAELKTTTLQPESFKNMKD